MTVACQRAGDTTIRIEINHGPVEISVVEEFQHLRTFWNQLGQVLNQVETSKEDE